MNTLKTLHHENFPGCYKTESLIRFDTSLEWIDVDKRLARIHKYIINEDDSFNHLNDYKKQGREIVIKNPGKYNISVISCKFDYEKKMCTEYTYHETEFTKYKNLTLVQIFSGFSYSYNNFYRLTYYYSAKESFTGRCFLTTTKENTVITLSPIYMNDATEVIVAISKVGEIVPLHQLES